MLIQYKSLPYIKLPSQLVSKCAKDFTVTCLSELQIGLLVQTLHVHNMYMYMYIICTCKMQAT